MAGGYERKPGGVEGFAAILKDHQRQIDALRQTIGLGSAIVRNGLTQWITDSGDTIANFGTIPNFWQELPDFARGVIFEDPPTGMYLLNVSSQASDGTTYVQIGNLTQAVDNFYCHASTATILGDNSVSVAAPVISLTGPEISLTGIPTVSSATYQLGYHINPAVNRWTICYITSSRKYKQDIADAPVNDAILDVQPRTWRDKSDVADDPDSDRWQYGAIAEEVHDLGLTHLVAYKDGEPEALQYDRFGIALIPVVRDLKATVATQAQQIADLTTRLAALEAA